MSLFGLYLTLKSFFVKKPTHTLSWTVEDFELGKKWAQTQPHPYSKSKTLWDFCNDKHESVVTIQNLNNFIK